MVLHQTFWREGIDPRWHYVRHLHFETDDHLYFRKEKNRLNNAIINVPEYVMKNYLFDQTKKS